MALSIDFPKPDFEFPSRIPLLAVKHKPWTKEDAEDMARRLEVRGDVAHAGLWLIARDERSVLELYQASQSFRYSRTDLDAEGRQGSDEKPDEGAARRLAEQWLDPFLRPLGRPEFSSVTMQEALISTSPDEVPRVGYVAVDVNFRYTVDGIPLLGPGAKAKVSIHAGGVVGGGYRFWRDVSPARDVETLPLETLFERFRSSSLFANLTDRVARAEVRSIRLGHLTIPPTEPMSMLIPALELRGTISTERLPNYEFVRHIAAIALDDDRGKEGGLINARPSLLLA